MLNGKIILVTGGLGYIGSHTIVELLNNKAEVICVDNLSRSEIGVLSSIRNLANRDFNYHNIDVTDLSGLIKCLSDYKKIDGVIHFAAYKSVEESVGNPVLYYDNNVRSLMNITKIADQFRANLVFSSSCTVYGDCNEIPIREETKTGTPKSPYGNTKKICEEILKDFSSVFKGNITVLRYFNPVGAHPSGKLGENRIGMPQNLLPYITQVANGKRQKLVIFGNDYATHDGTCIRDFIHVCDVAEAHLSALNLMFREPKSPYSIYNVGRGEGTSVLQLIRRFVELTKIDVKFTIGKRREGDIVESWAVCDKANQELNWKARFSLDDIILTAWEWEKNMELKRLNI
jgi:UDP-glucose 4-epimerase